MSKIINKRIHLNNPTHNPTISTSSPSHQTLFLLVIDHHHIAAVQPHAILIFNTHTQQLVRTIELPFPVSQIVYHRQHQLFVMLPKCQDLAACQLYTLTNAQSPVLRSYYRYEDNKLGSKQFEWQSWLKQFEQSQKLILIRKFYGYSLCVVFECTPQLVKKNEFRINEECISKLDEQKYMVNYRQIITRYSLVVEIVNTETNKKSEYKINEQIVPNTTKSIKLWRKEKQATSKGEKTTLTLLIAMNSKFDGYALMIVKVLQESNQYLVMGMIYQNKYEIYKIFPVECGTGEFMSLEYRYDQTNRKTEFVWSSYQLNQHHDLFNQTDCRIVEGQFQGIVYSHLHKQLVLYENNIANGKYSGSRVNMYRVIDKQVVYANMLTRMGCRSIGQQVLDLLV